ncbi:General secretion pathway protein D [Anaerohalosphaera lusitana]|uniref:General secretion pathway protein D n=1 Tax=Anaerohalosphaera lusitana TaxID=1936003 RepID=A0A1U9NQI1_9BACT|nr:secretin N-terminal domain-containing protein [Anaerohalosphaera lusitana]AQT69766.1 General secretion pathway protein D [Anaerohalosphaera lusitana]
MVNIRFMIIFVMLLCSSVVWAETAESEDAGNAEVIEDVKPAEGIKVGKADPFEIVVPPEEPEPEVEVEIDEEPVAVGRKMVMEPVKERPAMFIESMMLKYLDAEKVLPAVGSLLTEWGSAAVDENTNTLIICDSRENLDNILAQIRKADQTPQQVLIEVVILDVLLSDDTEIGVNWEDLFKEAGSPHSVNYTQTLNTLSEGGSFNLIQNSVSTTVNLLQQERNVEILASPRVLVVSGHPAHIQTVEEIPYTELTQSTGGVGSQEAITSTRFKDAGITLEVIPRVTDDGEIMLDVYPQQSVNTGTAGVNSNVPIVNKREAKTTLLMKDGQVLALGGLRRKDTKLTQDKIPLLGDLPLLGWLFSSDKTVVTNSELVVLISPHIYKPEDKPSDYQMKRFEEIRNRETLRLPENGRLKTEPIEPRPEFEYLRDTLTFPKQK